MHIADILSRPEPSFSFEFFPPKSEAASQRLYQTILELENLGPSFVSVTYGAGGSTRDLTHDLVMKLHETTSIPPVPHLTSVCHSKEEIDAILERYSKAGVNNLLALRGDPPSNLKDYCRSDDAFQYASELVAHIKKFNESGRHSDPRGFGIGVAGFPEGHPDTPNRLLELEHLKAKVDAGADYICTQLFFENSEFLDFRDRCRLAGINVPIIAGIMPISTLKGLKRMADLAGGTKFPAKLLRALNRTDGSDEAVEQVGIHYAAQQCAELLDADVDGIHFYTLNQSKATQQIYRTLGISVPVI